MADERRAIYLDLRLGGVDQTVAGAERVSRALSAMVNRVSDLPLSNIPSTTTSGALANDMLAGKAPQAPGLFSQATPTERKRQEAEAALAIATSRMQDARERSAVLEAKNAEGTEASAQELRAAARSELLATRAVSRAQDTRRKAIEASIAELLAPQTARADFLRDREILRHRQEGTADQARIAAKRADSIAGFGQLDVIENARRQQHADNDISIAKEESARIARKRADAEAAFNEQAAIASARRQQDAETQISIAKEEQARIARKRADAEAAFGAQAEIASARRQQHAATELTIAKEEEARIARKRADAQAAYGIEALRHQQLLDNEIAIAKENELRIARKRADSIAAFSTAPDAAYQQKVNAALATPARLATDTDLTYAARQKVAQARLAADATGLRLTEAENNALARTTGTESQLLDRLTSASLARQRAMQNVTVAEEKLAVAVRNAEIAQAQGTSRSMRENFITGFRGRRIGDGPPVPYAEQLGQAAKFSVLYGGAYKALFLLTQTLQDTLTEGIAFQDAMTDLKIASGRSRESLDNLSESLGQAAVEAGAAPSQGVQVGARALGLYGATQSDAAEQDRVARISAQVVSRLAVGSKSTPVDLQGDIASITQALGLGAEGQFRVADLDAYFTKRFGIAQGSTLKAVGEAATVGTAAGFTPEQLFAISADLISRTGQTDAAVAGYMAQIFSRGGEGTLTGVATKYGVDPNQELARVVDQLANVYKTADAQGQAEIAASFGRGKVQNAAIALLNDYAEVRRSTTESRTDAAGSADEQFNERMKNIGGQLAQLSGDFKDFAGVLGESGLLDVFGAGVLVLDQFLESVTGVLRLFNEMPRALRDIISVAALAATAKKFGVLGVVPGAATAGTRYTGAVTAATAGGAGAIAARGAGLAAAAGALINPITGAIAGLLAIGAIRNSVTQMHGAIDATTASLTQGDATRFTDISADQLDAMATESAQLAQANRDATPGLLNALTFGRANNDNLAAADLQDARTEYLISLADLIRKNTEAPVDTGSVFSSFDETGLNTGLQGLQERGLSAAYQLEQLNNALAGTRGAAETAAAAFNVDEFTGRAAANAPALAYGLAEGSNLYGRIPQGVDPRNVQSRAVAQFSSFQDEFLKSFNPADLQQSEEQALANLGVTSAFDLDDATIAKVARAVAPGYAQQFIETLPADLQTPKNLRQTRLFIQSAIALQLEEQAKSDRALFHIGKGGHGTALQAEGEIKRQVELRNAARDDLPDNDFRGRRAEMDGLLRQLNRVIPKRHDASDESEALRYEQIAQTRRDLVQNNVDELEALRSVAVRNARSRRQALRESRGFITREINQIVHRGGDSDQLANLIGMAGQGAVSVAQKAINDAIKIARAALSVQSLIENSLHNTLDAASGIIGAAALGNASDPKTVAAQKELDRIEGFNDAIRTTPSGTVDSELSGFDPTGSIGAANDQKDKEAKAKEERDSAAAIAAARARAHASRVGGQVAAARAAIASARAAIADSKRGTVEYYDALASLADAQSQLNEALRAYQANLRLLRIDATNPLLVARAEARAAAQKLRDDIRRGQARDVIAQDRVDLRSARANQEATAFSQRLSAVQTADELGRISHRKYIDYLENEKSRLEQIRHRTFQQQDQLDQVDRLLKDANSAAQGQFNFGDIKLPTPYQVRRYYEQLGGKQSLAPTQLGGRPIVDRPEGRTVVVNMRVDGADTAKVTQIVKQVVGADARINTTASRRR